MFRASNGINNKYTIPLHIKLSIEYSMETMRVE